NYKHREYPSHVVQQPPRRKTAFFPYTTLFRSPESFADAAGVISCAAQTVGRVSCAPARRSPCHCCRASRAPCSRSSSTVPSTTRDRKSTRLNSSHSQISYAVFCLKNKSL